MFALTLNVLISSANLSNLTNSEENSGSTVSISPIKILPVLPSMVMVSPFLSFFSPMVTVFAFWSIAMSSAPVTHAFPMLLATTAA